MVSRHLRPGFTLTEVLVALFITSIGLMAILTLFPLGGFQMAAAIKDDRCGHAAAAATTIARTIWKEACSVRASGAQDGVAEFGEAAFMAMNHPWEHFPICRETRFATNGAKPPATGAGPGLWVLDTGTEFNLVTQGSPEVTIPPNARFPGTTAPEFPGLISTPGELERLSYAVLIDPLGWENWRSFPSIGANGFKGERFRWWAGGQPNGLARRSFQALEVVEQLVGGVPRWNTNITAVIPGRVRPSAFTNDLVFNPTGNPKPTVATTLEGSSTRFSWSWIFQRPISKDRKRVKLTVMVYDGRQMDRPNEEYFYYWVPDPAAPTRIRLQTTPSPVAPAYPVAPATVPDRSPWPPPVKRGAWILDISVASQFIASPMVANANFHRVLSVDVTGTTAELELDHPPIPPNGANALGTNVVRQLIIFDKLAEVFDRGIITSTSPPQ